jgi:hypothetical protein
MVSSDGAGGVGARNHPANHPSGSVGVGLLGAALAAAATRAASGIGIGGMASENNATSAFCAADLRLFIRDVRDHHPPFLVPGGRIEPEDDDKDVATRSSSCSSSSVSVTVKSWSTVKDVKDAIQAALRVPSGTQRLYYGPLLASGGELPNHRTLNDAGIYRSGETLLLDIKGSPAASASSSSSSSSSLYSLSRCNANDVCISPSMAGSAPRKLKSIVQEARRGFALGFKPVLSLDGSAGTYFLHGARKQRVAVFKPADEEPYAPNNPRGYLRQPGQPMSLREGVDPGQACIREVAAYLLDHQGFGGVPMTTLAEARHPAFNTNGARLKVSEGGAAVGSHSVLVPSPSSSSLRTAPAASPAVAPSYERHKKAGSLQEFVRVECTMDDMSPSKLSVEQVHKIAILDIRILNADRNAANLLVRRRWDDTLELVPIDHGYCLRSIADVCWMDWCWLDWPQLKQVRAVCGCDAGAVQWQGMPFGRLGSRVLALPKP